MTDATTLDQNAEGALSAMPDRVFDAIVRIAKDEAGLMITEKKRALVQSRVSRRLRALELSDFDAYLQRVSSGEDPGELANMISVLTTNVSSFFRENHHFDTLRSQILPELLNRAVRGERIRLWSAGCSSGQEPYTLAMLLLEQDPTAARLDVKILATDIDQSILQRARSAEYDQEQMSSVPHAFQDKYFAAAEENDGHRVVAETVRNLVSFRELNLLKDWPMRGLFDVIFCRNVVIYFDETTQRGLWPRFRSKLRHGGSMFVGHSERIPEPGGFGFEASGVTSYRAV